MSKAERARIYYAAGMPHSCKLRANWGMLDKPPKPPPGFTDAQAASAKRFMERRGWTLVKNREGEWWPMRTI
jgi:hypothetical protein